MSQAAGRDPPAAVWRSVAFPVFLLIVIVGATLRLVRLDDRPMHGDEAVHAIKFGDLLEHGRYVYDPREYHGPALNYLTWPVVRLQGKQRLIDVSEIDLRLLPACGGILLIALVWFLRAELGLPATLLAALMTAGSPGLLFYSRYYIQEILLAAFTFGAIIAWWRLRLSASGRGDQPLQFAPDNSGRANMGLVVLGLCLGMMYASKETCVIAWFAMALAAAAITDFRTIVWQRSAFDLLVVLAIAAAVSAVFFSSFLQNPHGVIDSVTSYLHYLPRAGGGGSAGPHDHPWYSYLRWLFWQSPGNVAWGSETAIAVLALFGLLVAATGWGIDGRRLAFARFISVYTVTMILVYSLIPYKTPWCAVGFLHGLTLMAAVGGAALLTRAAGTLGRLLVGTLITAALIHLGWQACRINFVAFEDPRNPYVYAHTSAEVPRLVERLRQIAANHPDGLAMHVQVICPDDDYWPLPWTMRDFRRVGWFREVPKGPPAPVIVTQPEMESSILDYLYVLQPPGQRPLYFELNRDGSASGYHLRPSVPLRVYVRSDLWQAYRERDGRG